MKSPSAQKSSQSCDAMRKSLAKRFASASISLNIRVGVKTVNHDPALRTMPEQVARLMEEGEPKDVGPLIPNAHLDQCLCGQSAIGWPHWRRS